MDGKKYPDREMIDPVIQCGRDYRGGSRCKASLDVEDQVARLLWRKKKLRAAIKHRPPATEKFAHVFRIKRPVATRVQVQINATTG